MPRVSGVVGHVVTFGRVLRQAGLEVGPNRIADGLSGLDQVDLTRQDDVYWTLRANFVTRREEIEIMKLVGATAAFVRGLRGLDLAKPPGVAETIDWAQALAALGRQELDAEIVEQTLGSVLKYHEDLLSVRDETLAGLVASARAR